MKLLIENFREFISEDKTKTYYWQTKGKWTGEPIVLGKTHIPKANPRNAAIEEIFEEERPDGYPSRLNCVFLCENLEGFAGGSFCSPRESDETYEVKLQGDYQIIKTNSELWTEAVMRHGWSAGEGKELSERDKAGIRSYAKGYWEGDDKPTFGEIIISPPSAAIIVGRYGEASADDLIGAPLVTETIKEFYEYNPDKPNCSNFSKTYGSPEDLQKCIDEDLEKVDEYFFLLFIDDYNNAPHLFKPVQAKSIKHWAGLMGYEDDQGALKQTGEVTINDDQRKTLINPILSRYKRYTDSQADKDDANLKKLAGL